MKPVIFSGRLVATRVFLLIGVVLMLFGYLGVCLAQGTGGVDFTGTGGSHTINGRIYFPSGRSADANLKVRLENPNSGSGRAVFADSNGSFSFRNLEPGSYTIVVDGGTDYETVRESVLIDDPRQRTVGVAAIPRSIMVPIYLQLKRSGAPNREDSRVINAVLAVVPASARALYLQGLELAKTGDRKGAIEKLKAAVQLYPEFALALNELGVQYLKLGQPEKAAEVLSSAVRLDPDGFIPRLNYGISLLEIKDFAAAENHLRLALKKNADAPTAHLYLAITLINQRRYDESEEELKSAVRLGGDGVAQAHYYLGGLYWRKKEYKIAADELETYLRLAPGVSDAERIRGTIKELRAKQGQG